MGIISIILIAFGLTFDTFAVSISTGLIVSNIRFWQGVRVALILAIFQAAMPVLGWLSAYYIKDYIINFDHWIASGLLFIIGLKMIKEALSKDEVNELHDPLKLKVVIAMAIATSIDALIIGVSFGFLNVNMSLATFIIGFLTFLVAMIGMLLGKHAGNFLGKKVEVLGGVILILIGIKILFEHLQIYPFN